MSRLARFNRRGRSSGRVRLPEVIDAGPVVLRRLVADDGPALAQAVGESLEHLRPWMPWATPAAATVPAQASHVAQAVSRWESATDFEYVLRVAPSGGSAGPSGPIVGGIGAHGRIGPRALELGYWTHAGYAGRGFMSAAAGALTAAVEGTGVVDRLEIHTDEANVRSAAIPVKLGYRLDRVDIREPQAPGETGRLQIWVRP
jgi:RimJ/RimL family protein N-acetyltransferase